MVRGNPGEEPHSLRRAASRRSRLLLVDDDPEEREALRAWLEGSGYEVHTVASGVEAIAQLKQHPIEVVLTHLRLPGLNGIELLSLVKEIDAQIEVIILSDSCTVEDTLGALRGRAFDFLLTPLRDLRQLNQVVSEALLQRCLGGRPSPPSSLRPAKSLSELTAREEQILSLLAKGWENKVIAKSLCLGEKTVRNLLSGIYAKLGVANRTQAVIQYQQRLEAFPLAES
ncbi:Response regulator protein TodT [compost metagenome]